MEDDARRAETRGLPPPLAVTSNGRVGGAIEHGRCVFRGIPFAAPPTGPLRFRPPVPPPRWDGVRPCVDPGPAAPQPPLGGVLRFGDLIDPKERSDEDCLYLNVWTPACDDRRRPVLVWVHGGMWIQGSGALPQYDGSTFARDGAVLVTVNYRLGGLGFACLDGLFDGFEDTGNLGLLDVVRALEWVRENIAAFGGDPGNVTVFGQSAGAGNVAALLAMPRARGLFRRAIAMSVAGTGLPAEAAGRVARRYLDLVGVSPGDRDALLATPADRFVIDYMRLQTELAPLVDGPWQIAFQPVIDGSVLPRPIFESVAEGSARGVDLVVGATADEWRLGVWGMDWERMGTTLEVAQALFSDAPWLAGVEMPLEEARALYRKSVETILGRPAIGADLWAAVATDRQFVVPGVRLAEKQAKVHDRVYSYRFGWRSPMLDGLLGAAHGLDVAFFFDKVSPDGLDFQPIHGEAPPRALADAMHRALLAFAATGNPNHPGLPPWPAYETRRRSTMVLDVFPKVVDDPEADRRRLYEGVI